MKLDLEKKLEFALGSDDSAHYIRGYMPMPPLILKADGLRLPPFPVLLDIFANLMDVVDEQYQFDVSAGKFALPLSLSDQDHFILIFEKEIDPTQGWSVMTDYPKNVDSEVMDKVALRFELDRENQDSFVEYMDDYWNELFCSNGFKNVHMEMIAKPN